MTLLSGEGRGCYHGPRASLDLSELEMSLHKLVQILTLNVNSLCDI